MTRRTRLALVTRRCLFEVLVATCTVPSITYLLLDQEHGLNETSLAQWIGPAAGVAWAAALLVSNGVLLLGVLTLRPAVRRVGTLGQCLTVCAYGAALIPTNGAIAAFAGSFFLAAGVYLATRHGGA